MRQRCFSYTSAAIIYLACLCTSTSLASIPDKLPQIVAARVATPPVMDGMLDDPVWKYAQEVNAFSILGLPGKKPSVPTFVRAVTDGEAIYLGFRCVEPHISEVKTSIKPRDVETWIQEAIELVIDPGRDRKECYHLIANVSGGQFDSRSVPSVNRTMAEDSKWNGDWELKTSRGKREWCAEIRIPFSTIGADIRKNSVLGIGINRTRLLGGGELSSWAPNRVSFIEPENLGELIVPDEKGLYCQVEFPRLASTVVGAQSIPLAVTNRSDSPIMPALTWKISGEEELTGSTSFPEVAAGQTIRTYLAIKTEKLGFHELNVTLTDPKSGKALYSLSRSVDITPPIVFDELLYALYYKRADAYFDVRVPCNGGRLKISLLREGSDTPLATKEYSSQLTKQHKVSFDLSHERQGSYHLSARLQKGEEVIAEVKSAAFPYKPDPMVGFDKNGYLTVKGKPFFPVGMYAFKNRQGQADDGLMQEARDAGFNVTLMNHREMPELLSMLDVCERHDMKALIYPTVSFDEMESPDTVERVRQDMDARKKHPALIGWYVADEPEGIGQAPYSLVRKRYQIIKEYDQDRLCTVVVATPEAVNEYNKSTDAMWIDAYPIPQQPVTYVSNSVRSAVRYVDKDKPVWCVPQAFDWAIWNTGKVNGVPRPTGEEERCMTYLALINGAKGIIYWAFDSSRYFLGDYPQHWADLKQIASELRDLTPVLLTPTGEKKLTVDHSAVQVMLKKHDGDWYAFAANGGNEGCTASFTLAGVKRDSRVSVLFENRSLSADNGGWTDYFKPLEVHVYKLSSR